MPRPSTSSRFYFVDALRAVASVGVLLFHIFFSPVVAEVWRSSGLDWRWLFQWGAQGVIMFFVISGFVIAHSLRGNTLTPASLGRFILRRQVRLDPPYWAAMLLTLGVTLAARRTFQALPDASSLVLNALYLQNIFHVPENQVVLPVAWTLCLEIQFYLVFITVLMLTRRSALRDAGQEQPLSLTAVGVLWVSGIVCLWAKPWVDHAFFLANWQFFVAGVLVCWTLTRAINPLWLWSFLAVFLLSWGAAFVLQPAVNKPGTLGGHPVGPVIGVATALLITAMGRANRLGFTQHFRPVQFLGRISYSLYLTHSLIVSLVWTVGFKFAAKNLPATVVLSLVAVGGSVGFAVLFYHAIEGRSLKWANFLKTPRPNASPAPEKTPAVQVSAE